MPAFELTSHAAEMLAERGILDEWLRRCLDDPDSETVGQDGNTHYAKAIDEKGGRVLHVVINTTSEPRRVVTLFFDRRLRRPR